MEERTQKNKHDRKKRLRRTGLIVGLFGSGLYTVVSWAFASETLGLLSVVIPIIILGGILITALKKPLIGGILLVVVGFPTSLTLFGLPLLAAGILFLLSWREGRRYSEPST